MFPNLSCQEKCTQLFKTCNIKIPLQCKITAFENSLHFFFSLVYMTSFCCGINDIVFMTYKIKVDELCLLCLRCVWI